ncbi:hypothetical protein M9458_025954, partial [Cirrhinus mrigala]
GNQPEPWRTPPPKGEPVWLVSGGNHDFGKKGGWYPKLHSNGDRPIADTGKSYVRTQPMRAAASGT